MKISIDVNEIDNESLHSYIISNRESSKQFDELEKRQPLVEALVTDEDVDDVRRLFDEIIAKMESI